jgi:hypothetical protein
MRTLMIAVALIAVLLGRRMKEKDRHCNVDGAGRFG